ncbi:MAG: hypothetical protein MOB07_27105 [Acidobacteria bacterium]|nr:hypothetical protein [Acidobacteriota bacterium]
MPEMGNPDSRFLGIVEYVKPDNRFARVRPLYEISDDSWRPVNAEEEFLNEGLVYWPNPQIPAKDALIFFKARHIGYDKDNFMVVEPDFANEVIDLRQYGGIELIRQSVCSNGITWFKPANPVWLWVTDNRLIGPVHLDKYSDNRWAIDKNHRHQLGLHLVDRFNICHINTTQGERYVINKIQLLRLYSYVDWDEDENVVRRALKFAVEQAREAGEEVTLTKRLIDQAAKRTAQMGETPDLRLKQYRLERAIALLPEVLQTVSLAKEICDEICQLPIIQEQLRAAAEQERERALAELKNNLALEFERLDGLRKQCAEVESLIANLKSEYENAQATHQRRLEDLENEMNAQMARVLEKPSELLAESALLRILLNNAPTPCNRTNIIATQRQVIKWMPGAEVVNEFPDLRKRLIAAFKARGLHPKLSQRLHAAFTGGVMPMIAGPGALAVLQAYASVVTAGRLTIIDAGPSLIEPLDLFGKIDAGRSRFIPHASGLLDILIGARESEGFTIIVIEGANRGPMECYLIPLLQMAFGQRSDLALFHPSALEDSDPYFTEARLRWPDNVMIAGTFLEGPTTLPAAPELWSYAVLIQTDHDPGLDTDQQTVTPQLSEISPRSGLLKQQSGNEINSNLDLVKILKETTSDLALLRIAASIRQCAERYGEGLKSWTSEEKTLIAEVLTACLVPMVAIIEDEGTRLALIKIIEDEVGGDLAPTFGEIVNLAKKRVA